MLFKIFIAPQKLMHLTSTDYIGAKLDELEQ